MILMMEIGTVLSILTTLSWANTTELNSRLEQLEDPEIDYFPLRPSYNWDTLTKYHQQLHMDITQQINHNLKKNWNDHREGSVSSSMSSNQLPVYDWNLMRNFFHELRDNITRKLTNNTAVPSYSTDSSESSKEFFHSGDDIQPETIEGPSYARNSVLDLDTTSHSSPLSSNSYIEGTTESRTKPSYMIGWISRAGAPKPSYMTDNSGARLRKIYKDDDIGTIGTQGTSQAEELKQRRNPTSQKPTLLFGRRNYNV